LPKAIRKKVCSDRWHRKLGANHASVLQLRIRP
ncbi:MAG: hypothetical protein ACI9J2_002557, partial [Saprospiraceae bacterium]